MTKKLTLFFLILFTFKSNAGHFVGNGGLGYRVAKKIFLLDFVESNLEKSAYISAQKNLSYLAKINQIFDKNIYPNIHIASKLEEIFEKDPILSDSLLETMKSYNWNQTSLPLLPTNDENVSTRLDRSNVVQLAVRKGSTIYVDSNLWKKLDIKNQVGLVFHEAIYANLDSEIYIDGFRAREIVSFFFNPNFKYKTGLDVDEFLGYDITNSRLNITDTPTYGGAGLSQKFHSYCPFGYILKGIQLTAGKGLTSIGLICRNSKNKSTWTASTQGTDAGPSRFEAICNDDEFVSGAIIKAGEWKLGRRKYFSARDIQIYCTNSTTGISRYLSPLTNERYNVSQSIVCPENLPAAVGIVATLSDYLIDIGFSCSTKK